MLSGAATHGGRPNPVHPLTVHGAYALNNSDR